VRTPSTDFTVKSCRTGVKTIEFAFSAVGVNLHGNSRQPDLAIWGNLHAAHVALRRMTRASQERPMQMTSVPPVSWTDTGFPRRSTSTRLRLRIG
jgi:hypothetical protein